MRYVNRPPGVPFPPLPHKTRIQGPGTIPVIRVVILLVAAWRPNPSNQGQAGVRDLLLPAG